MLLSTTIVPHLVSIGMVNKVPGLGKGRVIVSGGHPVSQLLSAQSTIMVLVPVAFKLFLVILDPVWLLPGTGAVLMRPTVIWREQ